MPFSGPAEPVGLAKAPEKRQGASFPEGALDPDLPEALGAGEEAPRRIVGARERLRRRMRGNGRGLDLTRMDVLRTIAEALLDLEHEALSAGGGDHAVGAVPPPGGEIDTQQAGPVAGCERGVRRIVGVERRTDAQRVRIGRGYESRVSC